jgi:murein DD-endopeptidase MepM/ murein hydrolase activator NlpD
MDAIERIGRRSKAHVGNLVHAVDFIVPPETPIFAAADGVVIALKEDSNVGGTDRKYWNDGNYVTLRHDGDEYSEYEHLRYQGVTVSEGQHVKQGDVIGFSGNTGYSSIPHLHFVVYRMTGPGEEDFESLEIRFQNQSST